MRLRGVGTQTRAHFPDHVKAPVQYGARIAGIVVYLLHFQMLPEKRLTTLMGDLFGVQLTTATIAAMSQNCAARFTSFATALYARIAAAAVKHLDETGFRIGGRPRAAYCRDRVATFYRISPKRGDMPENLTGIAVHDHGKPYRTLEGIKHALCNAHHLRELKALVEIEKDDGRARCSGCCAAAATPPIWRGNVASRRCRRASSRCSSGATMPSWPRASRSTPRNPRSCVRRLKERQGAWPQAAPGRP